MNITDLQEIYPNSWKAQYHGNYGIYTVKIKKEGEKIVSFSCSCPSNGYPCKHIPMVDAAIRERMGKNQKSDDKKEISLEQLLKDVPHKKLCDFIIRQVQNNPQLKNTVLLEFAPKLTDEDDAYDVSYYNQLLQEALEDVYFDEDDIQHGYYEGTLEIDVLDQWISKAQTYVKQNNPQEAILICKACIEEFAAWYEEQDSEIAEYIDDSYRESPFYIILQALPMPGTDVEELLTYCKTEMSKPVYKNIGMSSGFNKLLMKLSAMSGSNDFIALQDQLLKEIDDKSSNKAHLILQRKIDFYRNSNQPDKADDVIKNNLQIESFREEWTRRLIAEDKLQEAKKLINDFLAQKGQENRYLRTWYELKLQVAQNENDIPEIRRISFLFIESNFKKEYYLVYKSTFTHQEWVEIAEKLIKHYEKQKNARWFSDSIADILQAEKQEERLMKYIEKHLSVETLEQYYTGFSAAFPEKTLVLFRNVIDRQAENTGRAVYEQIALLFEKMAKIRGGSELVSEMIKQYKVLYKSRRAMMEILNQVKVF